MLPAVVNKAGAKRDGLGDGGGQTSVTDPLPASGAVPFSQWDAEGGTRKCFGDPKMEIKLSLCPKHQQLRPKVAR